MDLDTRRRSGPQSDASIDGSPSSAGSIRVTSWRAGQTFEESDADNLEALIADGDTRVWVDLTAPRSDQVESIAGKVGLHPLVAEDIIERNKRAKVELIGDHIQLVMFALRRDPETEVDEVDFVLGKRFLLSVHPAAWDPRSAHQLRLGVGPLLDRGPDFLLWALVDGMVDGYFPVFDTYADEIDDLEDAVVDRADRDTLQKLFRLKRELITLRHVVAPTREIFAQLTSREFEVIGEAQVFYFRDVYDHLIRLTDEFDTFRELVTGTLELYLSTINNNLSVVMKRLTGVTVVLAGIGAIGGIFGMSQATPGLAGQEGFGFYFVAGASIVIGVLAIWVLRRIRWL